MKTSGNSQRGRALDGQGCVLVDHGTELQSMTVDELLDAFAAATVTADTMLYLPGDPEPVALRRVMRALLAAAAPSARGLPAPPRAYEAVFHRADEPSLILDLVGRVVRANSSAERRLGAEPGGLVGRSLVSLLDPTGPLLGDSIARVAAGWVTEASVPVGLRGEPRVLRIAAVRGDDGLMLALVVSFAGPQSPRGVHRSPSR